MDQFLYKEQINELQVELTNICNAACPMCARNNNGYGLKAGLTLNDWRHGDAERAFDLPSLSRVYFCGTHGEPIASSQLINAVEVCKSRGIVVEIFTNGSLRTNHWWQKLTRLLDANDKIIFGIDGIETNHLYRQNTDIIKILEHLQICCDSEVKTQWDFLAFAHNEHELDRCKELSIKLGVSAFRIRKTARFQQDKFPVFIDATTISHYLEPPKNPDLRHPNFTEIKRLYKQTPTDFNIECMYRIGKKMYINSNLDVYPCCYISDDNERKILETGSTKLQVPVTDLNLRNKSWDEILSMEFYKQELVNSFIGKNTLKRCIQTCGVVNREKNQSEIVWGPK